MIIQNILQEFGGTRDTIIHNNYYTLMKELYWNSYKKRSLRSLLTPILSTSPNLPSFLYPTVSSYILLPALFSRWQVEGWNHICLWGLRNHSLPPGRAQCRALYIVTENNGSLPMDHLPTQSADHVFKSYRIRWGSWPIGTSIFLTEFLELAPVPSGM